MQILIDLGVCYAAGCAVLGQLFLTKWLFEKVADWHDRKFAIHDNVNDHAEKPNGL